jgi:RNA:NAD 2'-phosphotransferase (TPT1/KptA family)
MGLSMGSDGYVPLAQILAHRQFSQCSRDDVLDMVATNTKKRFSMYVLPQQHRTPQTAEIKSERRVRIALRPPRVVGSASAP